MKKTLYDILEVSTSASPAAIKAAFERLRTAHLADLDRGDGSPENVARFNLVKEAYQVLSSQQARAMRDADRYAAQNERAERNAQLAAERAERDAQRAAERKLREAEREARQKEYEAQRRIEREKRLARELEYERYAGQPKAGSIPPR